MDWELYTDPWCGIELEHPTGWTVRPEAGGARVLADELGRSWAYGRWVAGDGLPSPESVAKGFLARLRSRYPTVKVFRAGDDTEGSGLTFRFEAHSAGHRTVGLVRVAAEAEFILVVGYMGLAEEMSGLRPSFERVLGSFRPLEPVARTSWREPGEGAFAIQVPLDWGTQGGVQRDPGTGFAQLVFQASADPNALVCLYISTAPQMFVNGSGIMGMGIPGLPMCPYCGVDGFVRQILLPQLGQAHPDVRVEVVRRLPQAELRLSQEAAQVAPGQSLRCSAAEVILSYSENGVALRQVQELRTYEGPAAMMMPRLWFAETPWSYRAPEDEFDATRPVLAGMVDSFEVQPGWQSREMGMRQQQVMASHRRTQNLQMATFWNISRDQDMIDSMIMGSYERRSAAQDRVAKGWSDATLGRRDVVTAWGDTIYGVEGGFNRYWTNAVGDVLATDNWLFEPGLGWDEVR